MPCIINAESGTGLTNSADGSGILKVQSAGKTTNALAWVNFNGTGTVAIRSSYNVSSITDNGVGDYTINFATALSDANYAFALSASFVVNGTNATTIINPTTQAPTASALRVFCINIGSGYDSANVCVSIFGN